MKVTAPKRLTRQLAGLSTLAQVSLHAALQQVLDAAAAHCDGPAAVRHRLIAEARDLLRLVQVSGRLRLLALDLSVDLRAVVEMAVPVPCLPDPHGPLQIHPLACLGLCYPRAAVTHPQPGYVFVRILAPKPVHLPCVSVDQNQVLCLGTSISAGYPLREIVLMTYGALSLQSIQIDALDPAGVFSSAAAIYWQHNSSRIPLSREAFLCNPVDTHEPV
jgi:hypothetical protein